MGTWAGRELISGGVGEERREVAREGTGHGTALSALSVLRS